MTRYSKGLSYELLSIATLRQYSFNIEHCGKSGDKGKDFMGHWILPDKQKIPVIGQCKNQISKCSPSQIREMEAVITRSSLTIADPVLGILVGRSGFTDGTIATCNSSQLPIILCSIHPSPMVQCTLECTSSEIAVKSSGHISYFMLNIIAQTYLPKVMVLICRNPFELQISYVSSSPHQETINLHM